MPEVPVTPQRKRWFILAGVFVVMFLELGVLKSYGVLVYSIARDLGTSLGMVGLATGVSRGLMYLTAPITKRLLRHFSCRQMMMVGGLIGSLGVITSAFSQSASHFMITNIVAGCGFSMLSLPAMACPAEYFPDKVRVATSIAFTGGGVGMLLLPLFAERLVMAYGWRGALAILGGLSLHTVVCGALLEYQPMRSPPGNGQCEESTSTDSRHHQQCNREADYGDAVSTSCSDEVDHAETVQRMQRLSRTPSSDSPCTTSQQCMLTSVNMKKSGKLTNSDLEQCTEDSSCEKSSPTSLSKKVWLFIGELLSWDVLQKDPFLITIATSFFLYAFAYNGWIVFVVPNAIAKGHPPDQAVLLATVGGVANIFARLSGGFFLRKGYISSNATFAIVSVLSAAAFIVNIYVTSFAALGVLSFTNGAAIGARTIMISIISSETAPGGDVTSVISLMLVAVGLGEPFGGVVTGFLYDVGQSFDTSFIFLGATEVTAAVIILVPLARHYYHDYINHSDRSAEEHPLVPLDSGYGTGTLEP